MLSSFDYYIHQMEKVEGLVNRWWAGGKGGLSVGRIGGKGGRVKEVAVIEVEAR